MEQYSGWIVLLATVVVINLLIAVIKWRHKDVALGKEVNHTKKSKTLSKIKNLATIVWTILCSTSFIYLASLEEVRDVLIELGFLFLILPFWAIGIWAIRRWIDDTIGDLLESMPSFRK